MTLNIKPGDWAVLRNGHFAGPIDIDAGGNTYPFYVLRGRGYVSGPWTAKGQYKAGHGNALDIIATLPCAPLDRIRQLEEALREIDTGLVAAKDAPEAHDEAVKIARRALEAKP